MSIDPAIDPNCHHSARLVMSVGVLVNLLECFDDLGFDPQGGAKKEAEGILKAVGPAAVLCSLLQASSVIRNHERTGELIDLFARSALQRRERLLHALPASDRVRVERREGERSLGPERVLELFAQAVSGLNNMDSLRAWGTGGKLQKLNAALEAARSGDPVDLAALESLAAPGPGEPGEGEEETEDVSGSDRTASSSPLPSDLLQVIGGVLAGVGADIGSLEAVLDQALPARAPDGYAVDGTGTLRRDTPRVGRNDPCPCDSGRKFKKCCGRGS